MLIRVTFIQKPHKKFNKNITKKKNVLDGNWEDKRDLEGKIYHTATTNSSVEILTEDTPQKKLLKTEILSALKEE